MMHPPRIRLLTLMVLVAVLGFVLGEGVVLWRIRTQRLRMAYRHSGLIQENWRRAASHPFGSSPRRNHADAGRAHLEPAWRSNYAAEHPWAPVPSAGSVPIPVTRPQRPKQGPLKSKVSAAEPSPFLARSPQSPR
jgi:hypothetical protein